MTITLMIVHTELLYDKKKIAEVTTYYQTLLI